MTSPSAVARHDLAQALDRHGQQLPGLDGGRRHERRLAGEEAELAEEATRAVDGEDALVVGDRDVARKDHEQLVQRVALPNSTSPASKLRRRPDGSSAAICSSVSRGHAPS